MDGAVFSYDGNGLLRIGGEIDMGTAPELEAALEKCDGDMELRSTFGLPDGNGERPRTPT